MFKKSGNEIMAAAFLMATSAIGPGFLTQTTVFTQKLLYNFGFIIIVSIIIDVIAQVTIWRTLTFSNLKAQQLGNILFPGLGSVLAICVAFGGLVFNIGNFAGAGMGINAMLNIPNEWGILVSAIIVFYLFYSKNSIKKLDLVIRILGILMLVLITIMMFKSKVDLAKLVGFSILPEVFDVKSTITLVGGTVGGYITFAGAQRLMDAGMVGKEHTAAVVKSASIGIIFTGFLRYFLFIGTLTILLTGVNIDPNNPTASVFLATFGIFGKVIYGLMIWAASITSVIGATYTSIGFLKDFHPVFEEKKKFFALIFVLISVLAIIVFGKPVNLLLFAGYVNGFILPIGLAIVLLSIRNKSIFCGFRYSVLLQVIAWVILVVLAGFAVYSLF